MINKERLIQTFMDLVAIDSPSGEEENVAQEIGRRLTAQGLTVKRDAHGNLIASLAGAGEPFLLSAHMDTVEPGRGIKPVIDGDTVRTDGSTILGGDPKAGVAEIIEGITSARESGRPLRALEVVITRGEEIGLVGSRNLDYSMITAQEGVVLDGEGSVCEVTDAAPAQYFIDVTITGRAAHAGVEPEKGIPAIRIAAELILALPQGRLDHETTANIGMISGGSARNAVSETCTVTGEFRSRNSERLTELAAACEAAAATVRAAHPEAKVELSLTKVFDGYRLASDHPLLITCGKALGTIGLSPELKPSGGATDANIFAGHGIAAAVMGMGGSNFHTTREDLSLTNLVNGARFVEALVTG